jgi:DNA repair protein RecO
MRQFRTQAIILSRTDYAEADRIITFLTPDRGKVKAIAKGVRKSKSKLAGGIELFSVSDISFILGRREIDTIVSTRLIKHYANIVKDLDRTNLGYAFIKRLNKATEDAPEAAYFELLQTAFEALDNSQINLDLIDVWFNAQLLRLAGHTPELHIDSAGQKLSADKKYNFDIEKMKFSSDKAENYSADEIKFLRLVFGTSKIQAISRVSGAENLSSRLKGLIQSMLQQYIRV